LASAATFLQIPQPPLPPLSDFLMAEFQNLKKMLDNFFGK
jgi:hypothetical protein